MKKKAEQILHQVGLSSVEAVRLFYTQVCLHKGLPFEAKIPNRATVRAIEDATKRKTSRATNIDDILND
ncbi:type II toxin-antitoxin system RelB/DinJ family antitoxin [Rickettsiales endosymbiont of Stachyamoeba lipophora]|uniref:type II toxin-antitoxin system RelB/DinJ family antitoxin n=1 Tax=Rickettsiales endosymbiont of Stachyamoeba lipophora TaxID=2486578 RepID=UPI000F64FE0C|nr:type II toxin-antitoxin system RelB/DinJ family antitoxin [Rickettsiales endosymbiont of Stachyamoeba lipophora]AZL16101.1 type II toxin-antitoxin system RelB/DinJ family antitoxin [Rickettsiales endosymbiont of Stachyamoeba lipophora]